MSGDGVRQVEAAMIELGIAAGSVVPLVGDASRRTFFRAFTPSGSVVAALYPEGAEDQAGRDVRVQCWGQSRGLPIPASLGHCGRVTVSEDVGDEDLEAAWSRHGESALELTLDALSAFQECGWSDTPTPPFDAAFFRRELAGFETQAQRPHPGAARSVSAFLDDLAERLERHPYRLVHRDFHANNLFLFGGAIRAVDYQDLRGGPDTYDAASLLRERAIGDALEDDAGWTARAAERLAWPEGWQRRYIECAAQRGLKVAGTFLRLTAEGRSGYLTWIPGVLRRAREAVVALAAPGALIDLLAPR